MLSFGRVYFLAKFLYTNSEFNTPRTQFICKLFDVDDTFIFYLKSLFKRNTLVNASASILMLVLIAGICLRIAERTLEEFPLDDLWSGFWVISVTITSVGYGDLYPFTHFGRFVCTLSAVIGVFFTSYLTVAMTEIVAIPSERHLQFYDKLKNQLVN